MEKKRYVVRLGDVEIGLRSPDSKEYIDQISSYVDGLIRSFKSSSSTISNLDACALSALTVADELFKLRQEMNKLKEELEASKAEISEGLGRRMMLEAELHEGRQMQDKLKEKCEKFEKGLNEDRSREEKLKEKLNVLSYELQKPHAERNYKEGLNEAARLLDEMIRAKLEEAESEEGRPEDSRQLSLYDVME